MCEVRGACGVDAGDALDDDGDGALADGGVDGTDEADAAGGVEKAGGSGEAVGPDDAGGVRVGSVLSRVSAATLNVTYSPNRRRALVGGSDAVTRASYVGHPSPA